MDGVSVMLSGLTESLQVPCLTSTEGQAGHVAFYDFPSHYGFSVGEDASGLRRTFRTIDSLAATLQSWLFFDLLSSFLEVPFTRSELVVDGVVRLDQAPVHGYFKLWRSRLALLTTAQRRYKREGINKLINFAAESCDVFEDAIELYVDDNEMSDRVVLSIRLLLSLLSMISQETLSSFRPRWREYLALKIPFAFQHKNISLGQSIIEMDRRDAQQYLTRQPRSFLPLPPGDHEGGRAAKLLLRCLAARGWCPSRARQLCQSHDFVLVNYVASLDLPSLALSSVSHHSCPKFDKCTAYKLSDTSWRAYPFCHDSPPGRDCHCEFVSIDKAKVIKVIDDGGIPIISMRREGDDLDLKVERCTPSMTYTAISHVWSDGLGNPGGNSIYRCQIFRLRAMIIQTYSHDDHKDSKRTWLSRYKAVSSRQNMVDLRSGKPGGAAINDRIYLWMDTLCVPRSPKPSAAENYDCNSDYVRSAQEFARDKIKRQKALQHITPIYAGAYHVLVLDGALLKIDPTDKVCTSSDSFAALILSINWMQRGWTLEEGCLAQNCFFQLMGKPVNMSSALLRSLNLSRWQDSPLDKATHRTQGALPTILKKGLMDEKRQLTVDGKLDRVRSLKRMLRIPQFVRTWNSLQERSITEPSDRLALFANLLDFNVFSLEEFNMDQKLPALIQSCHELPLSLLYNTGPRLQNEDHPEIGWIPTDFSNIKLVGGSMLCRTYPWLYNNGQVCYMIDLSGCEPDTVQLMKTSSIDPIPQRVSCFSVQAEAPGKPNSRQKFYVELHQHDYLGLDSTVQRQLETTYGQSHGTCILIDLSYSNISTRGFAGRGARFIISTDSRTEICLVFDSPLIAYTPAQWRRKFEGNCPITRHYDMQEISTRQAALLKYDSSLWHRRLARRPLLTQHPPSEYVVSLLLFVLTFAVMILLFIFIPSLWPMRMYTDSFTRFYVMLSFILSAGAAILPRKYLAMYAYSRWLRSFEEKWASMPKKGYTTWLLQRRFGRNV